MISVDSKEFPNILFNLKSKDSADMGVLIGYKYQDRTYIYSWCPTPKQEVKSKQISTLLTMPIFIQDATYADWVLQHTKEVFRLLPSGIQVLGLYSVAEEDLKLDNFALISASVLKLFTDLTSELPLDDSLCLFHFNLLDNRYQTGILDMKKKSFLGGEIRTVSLARLEEIRGVYKIDLELGAEGTLQQLVQNLITEWNLVLENSVFLIDKQIIREDLLLSSLKPLKTFHMVQIFSQVPGFCCNFDENRVRVNGFLEIITLAHPKATLKTVKELVIKDLLFSMKNRIELVSDEFEPEKNPFISEIKHIKIQLPRRISFTLSNFSITGYTNKEPEMFKAVASSISSVKLAGFSVRETLPEFPQTVSQVEVNASVNDSRIMIFWAVWAVCIVLLFIIIKKLTS